MHVLPRPQAQVRRPIHLRELQPPRPPVHVRACRRAGPEVAYLPTHWRRPHCGVPQRGLCDASDASADRRASTSRPDSATPCASPTPPSAPRRNTALAAARPAYPFIRSTVHPAPRPVPAHSLSGPFLLRLSVCPVPLRVSAAPAFVAVAMPTVL